MQTKARRTEIDWWIVLCWAALVGIGLASIYSSVHSLELPFFASRAGRQLIWAGVSAVAAGLVIFAVRPKMWEVYATPFYMGVILLLVLVLLAGTTVNGSKSWFSLGPVSFQPSELSKITTSLLLAHELHALRMNRWKDVFLVLGTLLLPMALILAEGETGTLLVYMSLLVVLYREGFSGWWIMALVGFGLLFIVSLIAPAWVTYLVLVAMVGLYVAGELADGAGKVYTSRVRMIFMAAVVAVIGVGFILLTNYAFDSVLKPHQKQRIEVLLGLKSDPMGAGYNVNQSLIAIGSGGFTGKGFLQGTQTAYGFVPEQSTDFIFCTIGEEAGFLGSAAVILLYCFLLVRIIIGAEGCRDAFTRTYGYCVAACLATHMVINIGMTVGLMPVIGIPLPFISYGGSSLLTFTVLLFIFVALEREDNKYF